MCNGLPKDWGQYFEGVLVCPDIGAGKHLKASEGVMSASDQESEMGRNDELSATQAQRPNVWIRGLMGG